MPVNLNGIPCSSSYPKDDDYIFVLYDTSLSDISNIDPSMLALRDETGTPFRYFGGYYLRSVDIDNSGRYSVRFTKKYTGSQDDKISALENNLDLLKQDYETKIDNPAPIVENYMKLTMPSVSSQYNDSVLAEFVNYFPEWKSGVDYKTGETLTYNSKYYRISQDHTSQEQWIPGSVGTESLYYEIVIASDGIIVWHKPSGAYDAPNKDELRHYPDADSPVYVSLIDGNAFSPDEYPAGWELFNG